MVQVRFRCRFGFETVVGMVPLDYISKLVTVPVPVSEKLVPEPKLVWFISWQVSVLI